MEQLSQLIQPSSCSFFVCYLHLAIVSIQLVYQLMNFQANCNKWRIFLITIVERKTKQNKNENTIVILLP